MASLRKYQEEALASAYQCLREKHQWLGVLATGTGKTVLISELVKKFCANSPANNRVLILERSIDLVRQTSNRLYRDGFADIGILQGDNRSGLTARVVVATSQTAANMGAESLQGFDFVIVDETHNIAIEEMKTVLEKTSPRFLVGLTATPVREKGTGQITEIFNDGVNFLYTVQQAVDEGYLTPLREDVYRIETKNAIGDIDINAQIIQSAAKIAEDPTRKWQIVFCPSKTSAQFCVGELRRHGMSAELVVAETKNRLAIFEDFEKGRIQCLVNVDVLTTGWDCPPVRDVWVLRPVNSALTYTQIVGRATRLSEGKEFATIHTPDFQESLRLAIIYQPHKFPSEIDREKAEAKEREKERKSREHLKQHVNSDENLSTYKMMASLRYRLSKFSLSLDKSVVLLKADADKINRMLFVRTISERDLRTQLASANARARVYLSEKSIKKTAKI